MYSFGDFFTNSSGRPESTEKKTVLSATKKLAFVSLQILA
jgi:hypothetical protein